MRCAICISVCLLSLVFAASCTDTTNVPESASLPTGAEPIVLYAVDDDLWQTDMQGDHIERITENQVLNWRMGEIGDEWVLATKYRPPRMSPDGRWIALSSTGRDGVLIKVDSREQQQIPGPGAPIFTWSPDSRYFTYSPDSSLTPTSNDLYLYDVQSQQSRRLLHLDKDDGVAIVSIIWSPDSRYIAFGCCFIAALNNGTSTGEIQVFDTTTGDVETVGGIGSSVGGGPDQLCWTADGPMTLESIEETDESFPCSYYRRMPVSTSPDGNLLASLSPASPDDPDWIGRSLLTVRMVSTDSVLWLREFEENVLRVIWSPDGQYLFLDNDQNQSPIWRVRADGDGSSELEIAVDDGYLIDVILPNTSEE